MKLIAKYLNKYKGAIAVSIILLLVQAITNLLMPGMMSDIVNTGIVSMNGQPGQQSFIIGIGLQMLLAALICMAAAVMVGYVASRIAAAVAGRMRRDVFEKVESFSVREFDQFSTASLITRTTNDIQQIQNLINMGIRILGYAVIMGIGGTVLAVGKSPSLSWVIALAVILLIGMICVIFAIAVPKFKTLQKLLDRINLVSRENLTGLMVVRAFGNEQHEEHRFEEVNASYRDTNRFVQRVMSCLLPAMTLIMNGATILIVWLGSSAVAASTLPIGDMMAFIQYAMMIIMAFLMVAIMFVMIPRATASAERISEVLNTESTVRDRNTPKPLTRAAGLIEFKNVSFHYEGAEENVLENITFTAVPGKTTAFIGSTGSGKSTLINLIPRFYDVSGGQILLDGIDIREYRQEDLREQIGFVPQKGILFSGTIASNIRMGKEDATDSQIWESLKMAQAEDFVQSKEGTIEGGIAQGGENVSGGQKQRLSIARALVKKPPIYIFDDSFSALDYETEARLRSALTENTRNAAVLIVAQRVSTIRNADQIIVLDQGRIVGIGTHDYLLGTCSQYREIAESQLTQEELA